MILKSHGIRTGTFTVLGGAIVAATVFAGVSLAGAVISHHRSAPTTRQGRRLAAERATVHAKAVPPVVPNFTYPAEGIDVSNAAPASHGQLAAVAHSPSTVLASLRSQPVPQNILGAILRTQTPATDLRTVTEFHPISSDVTAGTPFTAWVVVYTNTTAPVLGHSRNGKVRTVSGCTSVAIMDASTGVWIDFFQECGKKPR
jgi:hypothetical protein